jgi:hypothetical protein
VLSCTVWTYGVDHPARRKEGAAPAVRSRTIRLYIADHLRGPAERTAKQFTSSVWPQIEANTFLNDHLMTSRNEPNQMVLFFTHLPTCSYGTKIERVDHSQSVMILCVVFNVL